VALLYRSTRRLSLTQDGLALFEHAQALLTAAERGMLAVTQGAEIPSGRLMVTLPAFLARSPLQRALAAFAVNHPRVELMLDFSDAKRDLIREGIDLAIRIGELGDSTLKSRRLFDLARRLVCAPSVANSRPKPLEPADLAAWPWIGLQMRPHHRELVNASGQICRVDFKPRVVVNSVEALGQMAIEGLGLAVPPAFLIEDDIAAGRLCEILPDWRVPSLGVYAVWPGNAPREGLTARMVRFLAERLNGAS
jgi:DNA-binding transcriptional LysR family regulator